MQCAEKNTGPEIGGASTFSVSEDPQAFSLSYLFDIGAAIPTH
jgi:hypothetical protein